MTRIIRPALILFALALFSINAVGQATDKPDADVTKLNVVWSSADPDVAMNVCFMFTLNAKRRGWFDTVHLIVWGPSAKLLTENEQLQEQITAMQEEGVVIEACRACAERYEVADQLAEMGIDVDWMGVPLADRLKGDWKTITF